MHLVCLSKLQGLAGPVFGDVLASVEEIRFAFQGWPQEAFPVCFVYNRDGSPLASYGPVASDLVDLQTLDRHGDVVCGDVKGGGVGGVVVEDVLGYFGGEELGKVGCVVGVGAGFPSGYRDSAVGVRAQHIVGEVQA